MRQTNRYQRGIELTAEDEYICSLQGDRADYANCIADRNDFAIIAALDAVARLGCRGTRNRMIANCD